MLPVMSGRLASLTSDRFAKGEACRIKQALGCSGGGGRRRRECSILVKSNNLLQLNSIKQPQQVTELERRSCKSKVPELVTKLLLIPLAMIILMLHHEFEAFKCVSRACFKHKTTMVSSIKLPVRATLALASNVSNALNEQQQKKVAPLRPEQGTSNSSLKKPANDETHDPLVKAASNYTSYIIDQDSVDASSKPSRLSSSARRQAADLTLMPPDPHAYKNANELALFDVEDVDDDDAYDVEDDEIPADEGRADVGAAETKNEDELQDEQDDDYVDEDDFYNINPVDTVQFSNKEPGPEAKEKFDDFDDFDALKLGTFYGDGHAQTSPSKHIRYKLPQARKHKSSAGYESGGNDGGVRTGEGANGNEQAPSGQHERRRPVLGSRLRGPHELRVRGREHEKRTKAPGSRLLDRVVYVSADDGASRKGRRLRHPAQTSGTTGARGARGPSWQRVAAATGSSRSVLADGSQCALVVAGRGDCITFANVEWAARKAARLINFRTPVGLNTLEPNEASIHSVGELNEWTTRLLAIRFGLIGDEVAQLMEQIDVSQTSLWSFCPHWLRSSTVRQCNSAAAAAALAAQASDSDQAALLCGRYRTLTGQCNNELWPNLGASYMPFVRLNTPEYGDGVGSSRLSLAAGDGTAQALPPARLVSLTLHPNYELASNDHSAMFAAWGQLMNHDLALASVARDSTGHFGSCCGRSLEDATDPLGRVCMPIWVGPTDPLYASCGVRCLDFKRSAAGLRPGCSLGPRIQQNVVSSFVDASFVYGNSRVVGDSLRANAGQLAIWNYFANNNRNVRPLKPLLPPQIEAPDTDCVGRRPGLFCFRSGDLRTNQQVPLVALHTIHTRQHNRLAEGLASVNPRWSSERIFQEARHIHVAQIQHILISEYLPQLLGQKTRNKFDLCEASGYWDHYNSQLNPGISQEFAAAAFRQGHSSVPSQVFRVDKSTRLPCRTYRLRELFQRPWALFEPGAMDEFLLGLTETPGAQMDPFISRELSGHLFEQPNEQAGLDLIAINIQRGRDQGLAGYNSMRDWCGLGRLRTFKDLALAVGNMSAQLMLELYGSIDDIDLFPGGLSEFPLEPGGLLGPTFACIIAYQFSQVRQADRYWFETSASPQAFTPAQLNAIKSFSLARLICANSDEIYTIQPLAMRLPHPIYNPPISCRELPDLDMALWAE